MRISDWSSDVCSSDLAPRGVENRERPSYLPHSDYFAGDTPWPTHRLKKSKSSYRSRMQGQRKAGEGLPASRARSEEHTSELQSLMRISYAVFCLKKKKKDKNKQQEKRDKSNKYTHTYETVVNLIQTSQIKKQ